METLMHYASPTKAAKYAGIAENTLKKLRWQGGGPPYVKVGSRVVYDLRDLDAWMESQKVGSTSEAHQRRVAPSAVSA